MSYSGKYNFDRNTVRSQSNLLSNEFNVLREKLPSQHYLYNPETKVSTIIDKNERSQSNYLKSNLSNLRDLPNTEKYPVIVNFSKASKASKPSKASRASRSPKISISPRSSKQSDYILDDDKELFKKSPPSVKKSKSKLPIVSSFPPHDLYYYENNADIQKYTFFDIIEHFEFDDNSLELMVEAFFSDNEVLLQDIIPDFRLQLFRKISSIDIKGFKTFMVLKYELTILTAIIGLLVDNLDPNYLLGFLEYPFKVSNNNDNLDLDLERSIYTLLYMQSAYIKLIMINSYNNMVTVNEPFLIFLESINKNFRQGIFIENPKNVGINSDSFQNAIKLLTRDPIFTNIDMKDLRQETINSILSKFVLLRLLNKTNNYSEIYMKFLQQTL